MSLDWTTSKCNPPTPQTDQEKDDRTALIWGSRGVGLSRIKESNVEEWVWRMWHQKKTLDHIYLGEGTTPDDLRKWVTRWIGLGTNAPNQTRTQWLKRVSEALARETDRDVRKQEPQAV
jgi:hypothetical protein